MQMVLRTTNTRKGYHASAARPDNPDERLNAAHLSYADHTELRRRTRPPDAGVLLCMITLVMCHGSEMASPSRQLFVARC